MSYVCVVYVCVCVLSGEKNTVKREENVGGGGGGGGNPSKSSLQKRFFTLFEIV